MDDRDNSRNPVKVAVFDLDGTLTWHDTLMPFLGGYLRQHPRRISRLWRLPGALLGYLSGRQGRGELKSSVIRMVMGGDSREQIDAWTKTFVKSLKPRHMFRPAALAVLEAHRAGRDHLVLLSASPDLYVPHIGRLLGFDQVLCTELLWQGDALNGSLKTPNRRGEEKVRVLAWVRAQYHGAPVVAYGNSLSDLPHLQQADRALLVNGNAAARRQATQAGIPTADWR